MTKKKERTLRPTVPMLVGFLTVTFLVGGFIAWATMTEIAGAVVAPGRIVIDKNRQAVQHPYGGVVEQILVSEGDSVRENQVLIRLDPTELKSQLSVTEGQLFELMARRGRLEAERDNADRITFDPALVEAVERRPELKSVMEGQRRLFEARRESLAKESEQLRTQKEQLHKQVSGIDAQMRALERQQALIRQELGNQEKLLEQGLAPVARVLGLQREEARLAGTLGNLVAQRAQTEERIAGLEIQELQLYTRRREAAITRLRDLQFRELELAEQSRALQTQLDRLEIRAPISGVVYDLRVLGRRSVVRPAEPVMFLVPQDRPMIIEARVSPVNVDEVRPSQKVNLRFSAFGSRNTPELEGFVTSVSPDAFTDPQTGASFYRVEIKLPEDEQAKLPEGDTLIPGMPVDTFIRTQDRTPLAYLMAPLASYFTKAFRS